MKRFLLIILCACLCFGTPQKTFAQESTLVIPAILYHNIVPEMTPGLDPYLNISADSFAREMRALKNSGYNAITYEEYYNFVLYNTPLPEKPILINFDDGYLTNYLYAYPVLKELSMKATIFVITDRRGKNPSGNPHFSWSQAKEMSDSGVIDIQSHTHTHQLSTSLTDRQLKYELETSKKLVERNLGKKCNVLAYPFGKANEREINAAREAGYMVVNLVDNVGMNTKENGTYYVERLTVSGEWSDDTLLEILRKGRNR